MNRCVILCIILAFLVPAVVFSGGQQEAETEKAAPSGTMAAGEGKEYPFTDVSNAEQGTVRIAQFQEAPSLAEMVSKGELPSVEQRIPEDPLVLKPIERNGKYGGTIAATRRPASPRGRIWNFQLEFPLNYSTPYKGEIYGNVVREMQIDPEAKKFTLYLRKGMKWSDGETFDASDVMFYYEDEIKNDDLFPAKPAAIAPGGDLGLVKMIDDYTVEFSFTRPNPLFVEEMCRWRPPPYSPAHYLKQFHPTYTSKEEINKTMRERDLIRGPISIRSTAEITVPPWRTGKNRLSGRGR